MSDEPWVLTQSDGDLLVHTDVAGRAARLGHRLTIRMTTWQATVQWAGAEPVSVEAHIDAGGLEIVSGAGGVKPLSSPEKVVARSNALGVLDVEEHPAITFTTDAVTATETGYDLSGTLTITGTSRPHVVSVTVVEHPDRWELSFEKHVTQTDFGLRPYSLMLGSLQVVDEVRVTFSVTRNRP